MDVNRTGRTIARLRREAGLTQAGLAEKLNVSDKAVSKWERGLACPDVSLWNRLSILLDTDIESLIYGGDLAGCWKGILLPEPSDYGFCYREPLMTYLLSPFLLAGISDITVVCAEGTELPRLPEWPGITLRTASLAEANRIDGNRFVIRGNRFLYGANLTRHFRRAMSRLDKLTVLATLRAKGDCAITVSEDKKAALAPGSVGTPGGYFAEPFLFLPAKDKTELTEPLDKLIARCTPEVETMSRGMAVFEITSPEAARDAADFLRVMEGITGERIACPEEILLRRGLVKPAELKDLDEDTKAYLRQRFPEMKF